MLMSRRARRRLLVAVALLVLLYLAARVRLFLAPRGTARDPGRSVLPEALRHEPWPVRRAALRQRVIAEIDHSFAGFRRCAPKADELRPVSCGGRNWADCRDGSKPGPGIGYTVVDSMTTLALAGLDDHLQWALRYVRDELRFDVDYSANHFESTIRLLGSLVSTYELTGEQHSFLLAQAVDLADRLLAAYDTPSRLPDRCVNLRTRTHWNHDHLVLAEFGTVTLELRALAYHTGHRRFSDAAESVEAFLRAHAGADELPPRSLERDTLRWAEGEPATVDGLADSYFEYLLKQWVQSGFEDSAALGRFLRAAASIVAELVIFERRAAAPRAFVASVFKDRKGPRRQHRVMGHLSCFIVGTFAMADVLVPWGSPTYEALRVKHRLPKDLRSQLWRAADGIGRMCASLHDLNQFGVGTELFTLPADGDFGGIAPLRPFEPYLLRPEAIEGFFYMALLRDGAGPGQPSVWEREAWRVFENVVRTCRTEHGFSQVVSLVSRRSLLAPVVPAVLDDTMPSYWIAETLKYWLLIASIGEEEALAGNRSGAALTRRVVQGLAQGPESAKYVLNTEAHPLRVRRDMASRLGLKPGSL